MPAYPEVAYIPVGKSGGEQLTANMFAQPIPLSYPPGVREL